MSDGALSEAVSKKRGRPARHATGVQIINSLGAPLKYRTAVERLYSGTALTALGADENSAKIPKQFAWLQDKRTVLAQLGRLCEALGPEVARQCAVELCSARPKFTAKEAVAAIRRFRLGRPAPTNVDTLSRALTAALDNYEATHPGTTIDMMLDAINRLYCLVQDRAERGRGRD